MNKWIWVGVGAAALAGSIWYLTRNTDGGKEIEYRYAPVTEGELIRSTSSTGVLVPLTKVDVKSKAGGNVVRLFVQEGSIVKAGDKVAEIDPTDTRTIFDQAEADVKAAGARVSLAQTNAELEQKNSATAIREAQVALELAKVRLAKAELDAKTQPTLTRSDVQNAEASLKAQQESLRNLRDVQAPQRRREADTAVAKAKSDLSTAEAELERQKALLEKGYVSRASVERAQSAMESAKAAMGVAEQRKATLNDAIESDIRAQDARVRQAEAALATSKAGVSRDTTAQRNVDEAKASVRQAEVSLQRARENALQIRARRTDITSAQAAAVRSQVAMQNAKVQLASTTVVAPRDGVVTRKYLEEGTIIPPGTSTFSQGTSLVEISDTTKMQVETRVDEADIANIKPGQATRVIVEAYPGTFFRGKVLRIFPAADTVNNVTAVVVRVQVEDASKEANKDKPLKPGMNATVEFLQFEKQKALIVPAQAIQREGEKSFVRVKSKDPLKPEKREVKVGETGNDAVEILEGIKAGEEVVIAEIDLSAMRARQERMMQAQQPGGLGSQNRGGPSQSRASSGGGGGAGGGGGRPGGGAPR